MARTGFFTRSSGGRNTFGRICVAGRGGRRNSRFCFWLLPPFHPLLLEVPGFVVALFRGRSFIVYQTGYAGWWLRALGLAVGSIVYSSLEIFRFHPGRFSPLIRCPVGMLFHGVGGVPAGRGAVFARSPGSFLRLLGRRPNFFGKKKFKVPSRTFLCKFKSGRFAYLSELLWAGVGSVLAHDSRNHSLMRAGTVRLLGRRSRVRGVAKNPVDHPHGGGGGGPRMTPYGKLAKGVRTVKRKF